MKITFKYFFILVLLLSIINGCKERESKNESVQIAIEDESATVETKIRQIFYNMYIPTEMSRLFEKVGANYNPSILNSADNVSRYSTPNKIALNLGLYGVDMSYTRIFDQKSNTAKYFTSIQLLSEKLGIPGNYFLDILDSFEKYRGDKDSLTKLAGDIYERSDIFLKENDKESYAALVILGGWIEAIYIASKIAETDPDNSEIIQRIAEQKYSLNSIISLLHNYQDDEGITENILMLKQLKKTFDKIEIYYNQKSFSVDTVNKLISASDYVVEITPENIAEINAVISEIRMTIVD